MAPSSRSRTIIILLSMVFVVTTTTTCIATSTASSTLFSTCSSNVRRRMLSSSLPQMKTKTTKTTMMHRWQHGGSRSKFCGAFGSPAAWNRQIIASTSRRNHFTSTAVASVSNTNINMNNNNQASSPSSPSQSWDGTSMSQAQFMERDTVLVTDHNDIVTSSATKKDSHIFNPTNPRGILHRAFSVFLFDASTSELLLQKRASTKITFPNVWTNTCCSHPLHGMEPNEVDGVEDVKDGSVGGVRNAAVRKLGHELGMDKGELETMSDEFKFLTRVHYWAADTVTHGEKSPWGEHEIDYILFATIPTKNSLTLDPHPEEVDDIRWVTQSQLLQMFDDETLLFSPWFRIIANKWMVGGGGWWDDLDRTMNTNAFCDYETIHRFDPPEEHMGGEGDAGPWLCDPE